MVTAGLWRGRRAFTSTAFSSSIDSEEIAKFGAMAREWWDPRGSSRPLHLMNRIRIPYILQKLQTGRKDSPLSSLSVVDVGCGAGLICEPLARLGFQSVLGIDAAKENIQMAIAHRDQDLFLSQDSNLNYRQGTVEDLAASGEIQLFDVVTSLEVLEHVSDQEMFLKNLCRILKPGGDLFLSTLNQTLTSYLMAIVAAERVLKIVPNMTHDWSKFIDPADVADILIENGLVVEDVSGLIFNPLTESWSLLNSWRECNYILHARKPITQQR